VTTCFQIIRIYAQSVHNGLDVMLRLIAALTISLSTSNHSFVDWMCFDLISQLFLLSAIFSVKHLIPQNY